MRLKLERKNDELLQNKIDLKLELEHMREHMDMAGLSEHNVSLAVIKTDMGRDKIEQKIRKKLPDLKTWS